MATPPVLLVTRIWLGRASSLKRLRWNMYSPESTKRLIVRAKLKSVPSPLSFSSCIVTTGFSCAPSVVLAST